MTTTELPPSRPLPMATLDGRPSELRILVVEDEAIVAADLCRRLKRMGCQIVAAVGSGEEAIRLANELQPELILMDIMLQGNMDGIQAAQHLYSQLGLPVIYLTANSDAPIVKKAKLTEPCGYLLKPFDENLLRITIEVALYKHQMAQERERLFRELENALTEVKTIRGLLPICAWCHKIRDEEGYWQRVELYISKHTHATCSHSICPVCLSQQIAHIPLPADTGPDQPL